MTNIRSIMSRSRDVAGRRFVPLMIMALAFAAGPLFADEHDDDAFNLATITCWDLTGVEEDARVPALMLVFGYVAGVHDLDELKGTEIGPALERVGKLCTANPDMYVASAIRRVLLPEVKPGD